MKDIIQAIAWMFLLLMLYIAYVIDYAENDMGKRKRRKKKAAKIAAKKINTVVKTKGKLRLATKLQNKELNITGKYRVYKNVNGTRVLVQRMSDCVYVTPTSEQIQYLIKEREIDRELGNSVPTR